MHMRGITEEMISLIDGRIVWLICVLIGAVFIFGFLNSANAELYEYPLPSEVAVQQGDSISVINLTNSTVTVRQNDGLFSSQIAVNGTWTAGMPYGVGYYPWSDSNGNTGVIRIINGIDNNVTTTSADPIINVNDNVVSGTATPNAPIAVTVINPNMDSSTVIVRTDSEGNFEQKLNPTVEGDHNIYVTDKDKTTATSYNVEDANKNLETRLSVLKVLESILKIIYGSE